MDHRAQLARSLLKLRKTQNRPHVQKGENGKINHGTSTRWNVTQLLKITTTRTAAISKNCPQDLK